MTELAAGAVSSLLVVIRNEALLLGGVRDDVQFIKEEMESMNSFLAHLARSAPPGGEHDEQVRTWMNQVRLLAQDCNNCIDLYLYRGNPDIHRAKGMFRRYLWWVYWSLHKLLAQHRAAVQLRQLKDRARDVGERRLRYGVEVPTKKSAGQAPSLSESAENAVAASTLEDDEQAHHPGQTAIFERRTLDDYVKAKLLKWASEIPPYAGETLSIAIVAPQADMHVLALARDTLVWDDIGYRRGILVNIPAVHPHFLPLRPKEVLYYILRQLKNDISRSQKQSIDQCDREEEVPLGSWRDFRRKHHIYQAKKRVIRKIKEKIEKMKISDKLDKINSYLQQEKGNQQQLLKLNLGQKKGVDTVQNRKDVDQVDRLGALFQMLFISQQDQVKNKNMQKSSVWDDSIIMKIAKKLKEYIEADEMANKLMEKRGVKEREKETDKQSEIEETKDEKRVGGKEMGDEREEGEGVRGEREDGRKKGEKNRVEERDLRTNEGEDEKGVGGEMRDERGEEKSVGQEERGEDERKEKGAGKEEEKKKDNKNDEEEGGRKMGGEKEGKAEDEKEREKKKGLGEGKVEGDTTEVKEEEGMELKEVEQGEEQKKDNKKDEEEEGEEEEDDEDEVDKGEEQKKDNKNDEDGDGDEAEEEDEDEDDEDDEEEDEEEEGDDKENLIYLDEDQYAQILREVFLKPSSSKPLQVQQQATQPTITTLDEDRIKEMIFEAKQEVIRELKEENPDNNKRQAIDEPGAPDQNQEKLNEIVVIEIIKEKIKEQMKIKGIADKIIHHLDGDCPLIIFKVDEMMNGSKWEENRKALSLLKCNADALIFTTTESIQQAKGYCYPVREPIDYSLVGLYHDTVLEITSQQKNEDNYSPQVLRDILEACEPHELCMKIFTHALYVNPQRSNGELCKLRSTLQAVWPKSFNSIAKVMFKFSYNDLPKEYKSCLLYLAIFPPEHKIRRSTLIGRWVAEGLTLKEDWPSSVHHAHQCFDTLIHRCLVYPADIGATGNVKSCIVGDLFHGFITTIARKQHIVETRLSHHLARHFSIFNNLQLCSSDRIHKFFQGLSKSSQISLLKVLDLEDCQCFGGKNQRYLKDICSKMLLLKYLSLRGTDITDLPREINNLRELEILDIRQTKVPESATTKILLLKLKRLLAGNIMDPTQTNFTTSVRVPHNIAKMVNLEVLYNVVKAKHRDDLKDIGKLWQLRKLGVVIEDKGSHLSHLLRTISDLHECLCSLSITLPVAALHGGTPSTVELQEDIGSRLHECFRSLSITPPVDAPPEGTSTEELPEDIVSRLRHQPKILESLSISGTTLQGRLLPLFKTGDNNTLAKVTLSYTLLDKKDLDVLAELPRLRCVRLKHIACTEPILTFKDSEFRCLKYLLVEGSNLTNITFQGGAAELEKIVLSFTSTGSISGADKLPKLEEVELNSRLCGGLLSSFDKAKEIAKVTLCGTLLKQDALQTLANKPSLRCLVLLDMSFDGRQNQITFNKDEFIWLNLLVVDCSTITEIVFATGSAPRLEKIIWSSPTSLSGIDNLPRLKELEFNGDLVPNVEEVIKNNKDKLKIKHNKPETQDQAKGDENEYDSDGRSYLCWK